MVNPALEINKYLLFQESLEELNRKKKHLREAQEKLKSVHDDLQQKKQKKAELENEVDLCRFETSLVFCNHGIVIIHCMLG